ncbi:hypothetical protein JHK85_014120 [Glycine max]|uniref:Uncharacterized protein n=1 Tax=Glycine max TaxID=3847 RepID=K7KRQ9_SOYBN|nr:hypothetical protein JHK85_014120 [Glycine max]
MLYYLTLGKFLALPQQNFLLFFFNILIVILIPSFSLAGMVRTRQIRSIFFISSVTEYYGVCADTVAGNPMLNKPDFSLEVYHV